MRAARTPAHFAWALLLALLLALRSLAPAGFMPWFEHGAVTIAICPDGGAVSTSVAANDHRPGERHGAHQHCPYAAASSLGATVPATMAIIATLFFALALLLGREFVSVERRTVRERPPLRGPPVPA